MTSFAFRRGAWPPGQVRVNWRGIDVTGSEVVFWLEEEER